MRIWGLRALTRWFYRRKKSAAKSWDVNQLHWSPTHTLANQPCPLCHAAKGHTSVVTLAGDTENEQTLSAFRCAQCASLFFVPPEISSYHVFGGEGDIYWRRYIEIGAGLYEMAWPLACLPNKQHASLLDVGCGMGFTLDYWQISRNGEAVGAETATYGAMGQKMLGVKIYPAYLQEITELRNRQFDVVYASEVIEHVPDPEQFVAELAAHLTEQGVLVLTTPDAAFIKPESDPSVVLAALSPGFHAFLFSRQRLEAALRKAGFAWVHIESTGERLISWSSREPISRTVDVDLLRSEYRDYLATKLNQLDLLSPLWGGMAYRLFKESVNAGDWETAGRIGQQLESHIQKQWGDSALNPEACLADAQKPGTLDDLGQRYPFYLPVLSYYRAMYALLAENDSPRAIQLFNSSFELGCLWAGRDSASQLETLAHIWNARAQQIFVLLGNHQDPLACSLLEGMVAACGKCERRWGYAIASPAFVAETLNRAVTDSHNRGRFETAKRCGQLLAVVQAAPGQFVATAPHAVRRA